MPYRSALPSHAAAFLAGAIIATAVAAQAIPRSPDKNAARYASLDTFAQALSYIANNYVEPIDERKLIHGAIGGMARRLDEHSVFLPPNRYRRLRQDTEGRFGGVGMSLVAPDDHEPPYPFVDHVVPGSPAARAGVQRGDFLMAVNDRDARLTKDSPKPESWHVKLRGRSGTRVTVKISRPSWSEPRTFVLVREQVKVPTVEWASLQPGIGYLAISKFQEATSRDVGAALRAMSAKGLDALILDLRGNPGGILDQAIRIADLFLAEGTIVTVRGRRGARVERESAHRPGTWSDVRLLLLMDEGSASAAEIVAGALQDNRRATVMGLTSYGKGSVQTFVDLRDGSGLKITTARYYTPSGKSLEGVGITPDIEVEAFAGEVITAGPGASDGDRADDDEGNDAGRESDESSRPPDGREEEQGSQGQGTSGKVESIESNPVIERLRGDHQFETAYQTVQQWLGSKSRQ